MPITTTIVSSKPTHGGVYSIQHYVIKFVSDLQQVSGFLRVLVSSSNKTFRHDIAEIMLKGVKNCCFTEIGHKLTSTVDNSSVLVENGLLRAQRLVQIHLCSQ